MALLDVIRPRNASLDRKGLHTFRYHLSTHLCGPVRASAGLADLSTTRYTAWQQVYSLYINGEGIGTHSMGHRACHKHISSAPTSAQPPRLTQVLVRKQLGRLHALSGNFLPHFPGSQVI